MICYQAAALARTLPSCCATPREHLLTRTDQTAVAAQFRGEITHTADTHVFTAKNMRSKEKEAGCLKKTEGINCLCVTKKTNPSFVNFERGGTFIVRDEQQIFSEVRVSIKTRGNCLREPHEQLISPTK